MNKQIDITDPSILRITKIKDWAISFDYDKEHYLLHVPSDYDDKSLILYKRNLDRYGSYTLEAIGRVFPFYRDLGACFLSNYKKNSIVYTQADKGYFAYKLTKCGFASGIMEQKVEEGNKRISELTSEIIELRNKIHDLEAERSKLEI